MSAILLSTLLGMVMVVTVTVTATAVTAADIPPGAGGPTTVEPLPMTANRVAADDDILLPGDLISVEVYGQNDLSTTVRVPARGGVVFPLVGQVDGLVGVTAERLSIRLRELYERDYLQQAVVTVTIRERMKRRAFVMGSVARPSAIELASGVSVSALRAISECGGFLEEANRRAIEVVREDPASGEIAVLVMDSEGTLSAVNPLTSSSVIGSVTTTLPTDIGLRPNDLVIVPRLDRVYILGQVNRPGAVSLPSSDGLTLSKAISLASGFDRFARDGEVQLLRAGMPARTIDVGAILDGGDGGEDPVLKPGDTVYVPARRF